MWGVGGMGVKSWWLNGPSYGQQTRQMERLWLHVGKNANGIPQYMAQSDSQ